MLSIISRQGNANSNHSEVALHNQEDGNHHNDTASVGKAVKGLGLPPCGLPSRVWCFGKQLPEVPQFKQTHHVMQQLHS